MANEDSFIGMGHNPDPGVPDIPMGFGMRLFQDPRARSAFESLTDEEKTKVIGYIQASSTGDDARNRIDTAVENLASGSNTFFEY